MLSGSFDCQSSSSITTYCFPSTAVVDTIEVSNVRDKALIYWEKHRNKHSNLQARNTVIVRDKYLMTTLRSGKISNLKSYEKAKICRKQLLESDNHLNKSIFTTRESSG